ncbi:hypothetical protein Pmani_012482 [Petrolisthes manimaculis]|uniref:Uncharacterized protein n=1 Tax=Petrolisthes manimaculis TaxID=1843537 RepID=A0AAE1UA82_9EUCA|nr:hypothetical protein Pmani_012482 [Petrolisthes manimaculis]
MDVLDTNDPNVERAGLTYRRVMQVVGCYKELLSEKRRDAHQTTLHAYFSSKTSDSDESQPSTSRQQTLLPPFTSDSDESQPSTSRQHLPPINSPTPPPPDSEEEDDPSPPPPPTA